MANSARLGQIGGGGSLQGSAHVAEHLLEGSSMGRRTCADWLQRVRADDMALLEAGCQLAPAADNPYSEHPLPLQAAQQMEGRGRLGGAALAYEAAARVQPLSLS